MRTFRRRSTISAKCVEKVVGCGRDVLRDALVVI